MVPTSEGRSKLCLKPRLVPTYLETNLSIREPRGGPGPVWDVDRGISASSRVGLSLRPLLTTSGATEQVCGSVVTFLGRQACRPVCLCLHGPCPPYLGAVSPGPVFL